MMVEEVLAWVLLGLNAVMWALIYLWLIRPDRIERAINRRIKQTQKEMKLARKKWEQRERMER